MLLIDRVGQRQTVAACCADAEAAGVRVGMPAAQARALFDVGGVRLVPSDSARDGRSLRRLAVWAERFSPLVEVDAPDGLLLDVTGCARVFGSERVLVELVVAAFAGLGVGCRVVIAPTFAGGWALARFGKEDAGVVGDVGALRELLEPLPIAGLGADDATVAALGELGIVRIGDVLELPRSCLPARFGEELLLRLDRALGRALETIDPVRVQEAITEHVAFDGPTPRVEAIELAAGELLERVCDRLRGQERGARHVEIVLERSDLEPVAVELVLSRPSRDAGHLFRLARPRLEGVHLGFGVEGVA
ncbi:MAG: DNA polymerase Y family protein, partial [Planctomycetota bacterium]